MGISKAIHTEYLALIECYKELYLKSKEDEFLLQIGKFRAVRGVFLHLYAVLVSRKICPPIEELQQEEKENLWQEAVRISEVKTKKQCLEVAKALYSFGQYIQL